MTRLQRVMLLVALTVGASATATFSTPAQSVEEAFDCSRWRIYRFNRDDSVDCGCRCGFTDQFCCS
jgi:hypothetical protein